MRLKYRKTCAVRDPSKPISRQKDEPVLPARQHHVMSVRVPWGWVDVRPWKPK